jgi:hypothetical protein
MRLASLVTPALVLALGPGFGRAGPSQEDPPSRVGRLSFLTGSVSFRPGTVDDWTAATINYPLHTGDHLWTDADARAEVTVGSSAIRLASGTAFGVLALDDHTTQLRVSQGSLSVRLRNLSEDDSFEIDTPAGAVSLLRPGTYRVDVDSTGDTTDVTVRHGEAEVTVAGSAFAVRAEQEAIVAGRDAPSYDIHDARRPDDWDDWCATRDRRRDESRSARYVSRELIGYEDLDDAGEWRSAPEYGSVWVPRTVVVGWAPYRYGHWGWVEPWGWTWIDDAPWGFAPFHYGRWVYWDGGWAWVPGRVVARPVYAPALVAFVGGRNWSVAIGIGGGGGVAWFPLAPDEPYVPAYRVSQTYVRNVNVTNVNITNINVTNVNVTNITYRNRAEPGAVTVVSQETFAHARPVGAGVIAVPRERLAEGRVVGAAAVAPGRQSVLAQPEGVVVRRPPEVLVTRAVVVRQAPPPAPVPFGVRQAALRAHPGRPVDETTLGTLRASMPVAHAPPLVRPALPPATAQRPTPILRPARDGLPAPRPLPPSAPVPTPDRAPPAARAAERPAPSERPGRAVAPPVPSERPGRAAPQPPPSERPGRAVAPPVPSERPRRAAPQPPPSERPGRAVAQPAPSEPAGRPGAAESPRPERRAPAERPSGRERAAPAPAREPAATPERPAAGSRPTRVQPQAAPPSPPERPRAGAPPERVEPQRAPPPEERAPTRRPARERPAERDTTKEKKPTNQR